MFSGVCAGEKRSVAWKCPGSGGNGIIVYGAAFCYPVNIRGCFLAITIA